MLEYRTAEIRAEADGRTLAGLALPFEVETRLSARLWERFAKGSVQPSGDAVLNLFHDVGRPIAREPSSLTFEGREDGLYMSAAIPETRDGDDALTLVRAGIATGLSVEFRALTERHVKGVRIVERATVSGLALVTRAAYPSTHVEARGAAVAALVGDLLSGPQLAEAADAAGIEPLQLRRALESLTRVTPSEPVRADAMLDTWLL